MRKIIKQGGAEENPEIFTRSSVLEVSIIKLVVRNDKFFGSITEN